MTTGRKYLYLNSQNEFYRLDISKIIYFQADGNYTRFRLINKEEKMVSVSLANMERAIASSLGEDASIFARTGKQFIINLNFVYHIQINKKLLVLSNGATFAYGLHISREALKQLREMYVKSAEKK